MPTGNTLDSVSLSYDDFQDGDLLFVERGQVPGSMTAADLKTRLQSGDASVSVAQYGASGSGNETTEFQAAIDALPSSGGKIYLGPNDYTVTIGDLSVGSKSIIWSGTGATVNGATVWTLPGIQDSFDVAFGRQVYNKQDAAALDGAYKDNRRNAAYTGGATGELDYIERWETTIAATVGSAGNRKGEKAGLFRINNFSDHANGIALFTAAFAEADGAIWSLESTAHSKVTPTTYAHRSHEVNIHGYGADPNRLRWISNLVAHNETQVYSGSPGTDEVGVGLEIYPDSADMDYGIRIRTETGAGTTKGIIQEAALRIDTSENDLIQGVSQGGTGVVRFGSKNDSGIVTQILGVGDNDAAASVAYTDVRSLITDNTDEAEDAALQLYCMRAGTLTRMFQISAGDMTSPTSLFVGGSLKQVTEGAANSGGSGFKALVVPN